MSDHFSQINTIFANIKTTNICPIMTKEYLDIEKHLSTNLILKPEDEVELYQM